MHIFEWHNLIYLFLHLIAGLCLLVSVLGIPGNLEDTNPSVKKISAVYGILLRISWIGIKWVFAASLAAFFFHQSLIGIILSILNLGLGLSLFVSLVLLYRTK
ncbi:MAG: hypothetical protein K0R51_2852 [Cytophagaceae bacterium]|jgi:hypothetical protein|nr:hypothetical protein [Cytophagaceae bacterium]